MNEDNESPSGNLPAVPTQQLCAVSVPHDQLGPEEAAPERDEDARTYAMLNALTPKELVQVARRMLNVVDVSESDPARVSAAKLILDRFAPKEDLEQKRREAEEANDAIIEAKGILAEFAASRIAGLHQPVTLDQASPPAAADAAGE